MVSFILCKSFRYSRATSKAFPYFDSFYVVQASKFSVSPSVNYFKPFLCKKTNTTKNNGNLEIIPLHKYA